jgi:hypothetical protein
MSRQQSFHPWQPACWDRLLLRVTGGAGGVAIHEVRRKNIFEAVIWE